MIDLSVKPNTAHIFFIIYCFLVRPWPEVSRSHRPLSVRGFIKLSRVGRWACPADMWFWGKCSHHMIWSEVNTWSSVVSWRAELLSDNRPDGQRTGKAWLSKQHMTPTNIFVRLCLFVPFILSDSLSVTLLWSVTLSSLQPSTSPLSQYTKCSRDFFFLNYWFVVGICSIACLSGLTSFFLFWIIPICSSSNVCCCRSLMPC